MASMDVTPQELRDIEIREAWRGYHRDDVDELLERAAATIEHLQDEVRQAQLRAAQAPPSPPAARTPAVAAPPPVPERERREPGIDTDVIQRTLVMAQKAADDAVADARHRAQQIVTESESKAQAVVTEAEANARRIAESERRRLEEEIGQLTAARDTLNADVDALERFEDEYKQRLRVAINAELAALEAAGHGGGDRPSLHAVHVPAPRSWAASDSWSSSSGSSGSPSAALPSAGSPTVSISAVPAHDEWDDTSGEWSETPTAAVVDDSAEQGLAPEHGDSLDDDAFFASLREAVRDDTPLGSRESTSENFFDADEPDDQRKLFRRKR
jgi:DivIVA domain-containing protein